VKRNRLKEVIENRKIDLKELALRNSGSEIPNSLKSVGKDNITEVAIYRNERQKIELNEQVAATSLEAPVNPIISFEKLRDISNLFKDKNLQKKLEVPVSYVRVQLKKLFPW